MRAPRRSKKNGRTCPHCGEPYTPNGKLWSCEFCCYAPTNKKALKRHMTPSTAERPREPLLTGGYWIQPTYIEDYDRDYE